MIVTDPLEPKNMDQLKKDNELYRLLTARSLLEFMIASL
jgi:hypothetical protein